MKNQNLFIGRIGRRKLYFKNEKIKNIYELVGVFVCLAFMYFYYILFYAIIKGY